MYELVLWLVRLAGVAVFFDGVTELSLLKIVVGIALFWPNRRLWPGNRGDAV